MSTTPWRRAATALTASILLAATSAFPASAEGQSGTTLTAGVTLSVSNTLTYPWTIDKSVSPANITMFEGDSADARYTVAVTRGAGVAAMAASGQVCVLNGGAVATEGLAISATTYNQSVAGSSKPMVGSGTVSVASNPVLDPGEQGCYPYSYAVSGVSAGDQLKTTADITITNHSGSLGMPFGPSPSATAYVPTATPVNASINVDDTYDGKTWAFSGSGSVTYGRTFTAAGTYNNTATIRETGQSDSASVTVTTYALSVAATATTAWNRSWAWAIDKTVNPTSMTLAIGQTSPLITWTVIVTPTKTDSGYAVSGDVTVTNPAPIAATLTSVSATLAGSPVVLSCPALTVAAHSSLVCTYSVTLPDADPETLAVSVVQQNYSYTYLGVASPSGTTSSGGSANVVFSGTPTTETDETVTVTDDLYGSLGTWSAGGGAKTYTYTTTAGPYAAAGTYYVTNTAVFVTNDSGTTGNDSAQVVITVPPNGMGCTLTQGYWKTHSAVGPAPYDDLWARYQAMTFFSSGKTWYQVYWTAPAGNAYYNLAHQYMAAVMNKANGASSTTSVDAAIAASTTFFQTYAPTTSWSKAQKAQMTTWAAILASYNEGMVGPGHCSE